MPDDSDDDVSADVAERENWDAETGEVDSSEEETGPESVAVRQMFLDWLASHLATVEVVGTKPTPWCTEWWLHPEVVARFKALWQASMQADANVMEGDAGAVSSWWINHWDRHAAVIFDKGNGPFRDCDPAQGHLSRRKDTAAVIVPASMPPADVDL